MTTQHTPTPWFTTGGDLIQAKDAGCALLRMMSASQEKEANAAFIVKAVNNHEELLSILSELIDLRGQINYDSVIWNEAIEAVNKAKGE